jgi:hypothetical protein
MPYANDKMGVRAELGRLFQADDDPIHEVGDQAE